MIESITNLINSINPDVINASFEGLGAIFLFMNVIKLHQDKVVRGIYWPTTAFFTVWGYWNIFYYYDLQQFYSWTAGIFIVVVNTIWLFQMIYYIRAERKEFLRVHIGFDDN